MHLDGHSDAAPSRFEQIEAALQDRDFETLDVDEDPVGLDLAAAAKLIQRSHFDRDCLDLLQEGIRLSQAAHPAGVAGVERGASRLAGDGALDDFDWRTTTRVPGDMSAQIVGCLWIRLEGEHTPAWSRPIRELQRIDADIGPHVEAGHARSNSLAKKGGHRGFIIGWKQPAVLGQDADVRAIDHPLQPCLTVEKLKAQVAQLAGSPSLPGFGTKPPAQPIGRSRGHPCLHHVSLLARIVVGRLGRVNLSLPPDLTAVAGGWTMGKGNRPLDRRIDMSLIIDGYNLLHVTGRLGRGRGPGVLEKARLALLNLLVESLPPEELPATTIVFDARHAPPDVPHSLEHRGLAVRFAHQHEEADELIEELIRSDSAPRRLTVVSSDHRLQAAARRRRAKAVDSESWLEALLRDRHQRRQQRPSPAKPEGEISPSEVEYWLHEFDTRKDP